MPTATGNYVLTNDVTLGTDGWNPANGTVLCLNGHTLTLKAVNAHYDFTLCDCAGNGKIIGTGGSVYTIAIAGSYNFTMYGGTVSGGDEQSGVYVYGRFDMYGGTIANGMSSKGGGVRLEKISYAAEMTMYGGSITGNQAENEGGGVYICDGTTFTMHGGTISDNTAGGSGGGVRNDGTFIISNGVISSNTALDGGGVYHGDGLLLIKGTPKILGNTALDGTHNLLLETNGNSEYRRITIDSIGSDASVGISLKGIDENEIETIFTDFTDSAAQYKDNFFSDNAAYAIAVGNNNLKLVEKTVQVGEVTLKDGEYTTDGQATTITKPESDGYAYYKNGVLMLNNFTYSGGGNDYAAIYCEYDLTIKVEGRNSITREVTGKDTDTLIVLRGIWVRS